MRNLIRTTVIAAALTTAGAGALLAQATHVVRLVANSRAGTFRFDPATVVARPHDVILFQVGSGAPHNVSFDGAGMSPGVRGAFNNAMPDRAGDLSSPLLTASGKEYRMVVPQVPPGAYQFYCLPHRAYDMRGTLTVQ